MMSHWSYLFIKSFNPPIQVLGLVLAQILTVIQRPVKVLRQHVFVKRLISEAPRGISAGKILVRPAGTVEISSGRNVVDFPSHGEVDGFATLAVVLQQCSGGVGLEYDGRRTLGEGDGRRGTEAIVGQQEKEGE